MVKNLALNNTASWKAGSGFEFHSSYFQFTLSTWCKSALSNVQKDCVSFVCLELEHVFSQRQFLKGKASQSNPRRLIYALLLFKFYLQEKLQEQDVSMMVMKVNIKAHGKNKE